jgi:hypothetical protein
LVKSHFKTSIFNKYTEEAVISSPDATTIKGKDSSDEADEYLYQIEHPKEFREVALDPKTPEATQVNTNGSTTPDKKSASPLSNKTSN